MLTLPEGQILIQDSSGNFVPVSAQGTSLVVRPNIVTRGLVSYWALEEDSMASGGIKDTAYQYGVSGKPNDGTRYGSAPNSNDGILGRCQYFSGDDYILVPDSPSLYATNNTPFSIDFWYKPPVGSTTGNLISKGVASARWCFSYYNTGFIGNTAPDFAIETSTGWVSIGAVNTPNTFLIDGNWHHCTITYDGSANVSGLKMYIDGVEPTVSRYGTTLGTFATTQTLNFGIGSLGSSTGLLDEVKYYNVALTANEVQQNYQTYGPRVIKQGLVSWWKLKDNAKDCAKIWSASGGNNDGVLTNGAQFIGGELVVDGVADHINAPTSASLDFVTTGNYTIETWVKWSTSNSTSTQSALYWIQPSLTASIMGINIGDSATPGSRTFQLQTQTGTHSIALSSTSFIEGAWNHLVFTYNNGTNNGYVNGVFSHTGSSTSPTNSGTIYIGVRQYGPNQPYKGSIKDSRIYNRALSATEIALNYSAGRSR